jgi:hypothetical protein
MALFEKDIAEIQLKIQGVLGKRAWGVARSDIATFVTLEFGPPQPPKRPHGKSHGEWHLWIYGGAWRVEKEGRVVVASDDEYTTSEMQVRCLEGRVLQSFEIMTPALDAVLTFEQEIILRIFSTYSEETEETGMDTWKLYTPDKGKVIQIHAGGTWSYGL